MIRMLGNNSLWSINGPCITVFCIILVTLHSNPLLTFPQQSFIYTCPAEIGGYTWRSEVSRATRLNLNSMWQSPWHSIQSRCVRLDVGSNADNGFYDISVGIRNLEGIPGLSVLDGGAQGSEGDFTTIVGAHEYNAALDLFSVYVHPPGVRRRWGFCR